MLQSSPDWGPKFEGPKLNLHRWFGQLLTNFFSRKRFGLSIRHCSTWRRSPRFHKLFQPRTFGKLIEWFRLPLWIERNIRQISSFSLKSGENFRHNRRHRQRDLHILDKRFKINAIFHLTYFRIRLAFLFNEKNEKMISSALGIQSSTD